jgi:hypothetical protein
MSHRDYDQPTVVEAICERLAQGKSLASICRAKDMPTLRTFLRWCDSDDSVAAEYNRALQARAEWFSAEHDRIRKTAVDRDSAAAARVQLSGLEWQMGRMAPRRYGDRLDVSVDANLDLGSILDRARQRVVEGQLAAEADPLPAPRSLLEAPARRVDNAEPTPKDHNQ